MKSELSLSEDINVITAEINAYQRVAGESIFEIGKRMKHVKENDLTHGEWVESVGMTRQHANRFISVYNELGNTNGTSMLHLGITALHQIATMPAEQREIPHELESGKIKTPDEMTVRELAEVNKALKQSKLEKEEAELKAHLIEDKNNQLTKVNQELNNKLKEAKTPATKTVEVEKVVEVDKTDYTLLERMQQEKESMEAEYKRLAIRNELAVERNKLLEERLKQEETDADEHRASKGY